MSKIICHNCNTEVYPNGTYCYSCGQRVIKPTACSKCGPTKVRVTNLELLLFEFRVFAHILAYPGGEKCDAASVLKEQVNQNLSEDAKKGIACGKKRRVAESSTIELIQARCKQLCSKANAMLIKQNTELAATDVAYNE